MATDCRWRCVTSLLSQRIPRSLSREGRVELLAEVAAALLRGETPSKEAAMFVGSALSAWLRTGGVFERHARVGAPRGSHRKPEVLYARLIADERRGDEPALQSAELITDKEPS